ncbi:MAG: hypothetical protein M3314_02640 [Actinomycetota bacterium]|nr:hypothetical protein [Actinomycetota bacterium]
MSGWTACLPDATAGPLWAEPFAEDLRRACTQAFDAFGRPEPGTPLTLPISVPFDEHGVVVLSSAPPKPDAPRVPAELELVAGSPPSTPYRFGLALGRVDREPLLVPGLTRAEAQATGEPVPLTLLTFALTDRGIAIAGYDADSRVAPLALDETTARALAIALLITIGVKLRKAGYSG